MGGEEVKNMAGEPVPALATVVVTNGAAVTVPGTPGPMYCKLGSTGDITNVTVTLTTANDTDTVTVNGAALTSLTFSHNFKTGPTVTIVVANAGAAEGTSPVTYTLTVYDGVQEVNVANIINIGWWPARRVTGDLDKYAAGGLYIPLGTFKPKFVVNVQITDGFVGYFDIASGKLKVYKSNKTEATEADLATAKYDMILME